MLKNKRMLILVLLVIIFPFLLENTMSLSETITPKTGHCFTPLTAGPYSGNYLCTNNITALDDIEARIKVDSTSGYGWINTTWATGISNTSIITSAVLNVSVKATAMANVFLQIQVFNDSSGSWMNASECIYNFTSSNNLEDKLCNISQFVSRASSIYSLQIRSLAYRTSGGGAEEQVDIESLSFEYSPEDSPNAVLDAPLNGSIFRNRAVTFNATFTDDISLKNTTLYVWNSSNNIINSTTVLINGTLNYTNISFTTPYDGVFAWNYLVCDTSSNCALNNTNFTFIIDTIVPLLEIAYPSSIFYNASQTRLNYTASDSLLSSCWYSLDDGATNTTVTCGNNLTGLTSNEGENTWRVYANDTAGNLNSTSVMFTVDSISPLVTITSPSNGSTLGSNQSINLSLSILEANIGNCWYHIDSGLNTTFNCSSTTFNTTEGSHTIYAYVNDSVGNTASSSSLFSVSVGAPSISLVSPINTYLNYNEEISLVYIPEDTDLTTCSLWGDFNGTYELHQTVAAVSGTTNSFSRTLNDGTYLWAISCNDSLNNFAMSANQTFYVDTIRPSATVNAPTGTYSSLSNIPVDVSVSDASPVQCFYNVTRSTGNVEIPNSELIDCEPTTFSLDIETSYFLWMMVNDSAGNVNISRNSFTISVPSGGGGGGSSSGGGGGSRGVGLAGRTVFEIGLGELDALKINRGQSETVELSVKNNGLRFLNSCKFFTNGGISDWISGEDIESLSPGQSSNYIFTVNVPTNAEVGSYFATLGVNCLEYNKTFTYQVDVIGGEFELTILNSERIGTKLRTTYAVKNFGDKTKKIQVSYKFFDDESDLIVEGSDDDAEIPAGELYGGVVEFELPKNSIGNYVLVIEATDGADKTQKQEAVRLTSGGIAGFAISENNLKTIGWFGVVIMLSFGIYSVLKTIRRQLAIKKANDELSRQFITIDLDQ